MSARSPWADDLTNECDSRETPLMQKRVDRKSHPAVASRHGLLGPNCQHACPWRWWIFTSRFGNTDLGDIQRRDRLCGEWAFQRGAAERSRSRPRRDALACVKV